MSILDNVSTLTYSEDSSLISISSYNIEINFRIEYNQLSNIES